MTIQIGSLWFVCAIHNPRIRLSKGFETEGEADAYLAVYAAATDPIVGR